MGQCYSFVCNDCKVKIDLDKIDNARQHLKPLLDKHKEHDIEISDHSEYLDELEMYEGYKQFHMYNDFYENVLEYDEFIEIVQPLIKKYIKHVIDYQNNIRS